MRKTAHVYGAIALHDARFTHQFASVFNGRTFFDFLKTLVMRYRRRKLFLIIDSGPYHWLSEDGRQWLHAKSSRIDLHRLPPHSRELNVIEGVWKTTKRPTTHNRFYPTTEERDAALVKTFDDFRRSAPLVENHLVRFR